MKAREQSEVPATMKEEQEQADGARRAKKCSQDLPEYESSHVQAPFALQLPWCWHAGEHTLRSRCVQSDPLQTLIHDTHAGTV